MHLFLPAPDCAPFLVDELNRAGAAAPAHDSLGWVTSETLPAQPWLGFAQQSLPHVTQVKEASINAWADHIISRIAGILPDSQPWRLHLWPAYGEGRAGLHRCDLILAAFQERLKKRRRLLLKSLQDSTAPFDAETSVVQAVLTGPDSGFVSVSMAPEPLHLRAILSTAVGGYIPHAEDKAAPSRAFAKVIEAELRLGQQIEKGQTCVDLGASPGSWSYVAIQRGARVIAIDRSPLREDLMRNPRLDFQQADAFKFRPEQPVDWLVCDIIAAPQRSLDLLADWLREKQMRRFIVTLKFKGTEDYPILDEVKKIIPDLCSDFRLSRLCANKNEVTAFGVAAE